MTSARALWRTTYLRSDVGTPDSWSWLIMCNAIVARHCMEIVSYWDLMGEASCLKNNVSWHF